MLRGKQGAFYNMLQEFSQFWERIDVICPRPVVSAATKNLPMNLSLFGNVFFHPSSQHLWRQPWWIERKGSELITQYHHDVMTVHEYPPFYNGIGAKWLHKKTNVPYVLEIHHIVGYPRSSSFSEWIGKVMSRFYLYRDTLPAARVRVVNQTVYRLLKALGVPAQKIAIVPSFYLDPTILKPSQKIEKRYDVVFCGRLVKNKGLIELIDALYELSRVTLLIIGDGTLKEQAERRVAKLGMQDRVTFMGWLPTLQDVTDTIQSGRLFVMNSLSEGGPRVALEAMACGMPIVSTAVGIMPDVIQNGINGILVSGDKSDLAAKIDYLLREPHLRLSMGEHAQSIVSQFEKGTLISQYTDFLKGVGQTAPVAYEEAATRAAATAGESKSFYLWLFRTIYRFFRSRLSKKGRAERAAALAMASAPKAVIAVAPVASMPLATPPVEDQHLSTMNAATVVPSVAVQPASPESTGIPSLVATLDDETAVSPSSSQS